MFLRIRETFVVLCMLRGSRMVFKVTLLYSGQGVARSIT